MQKLAEEEVDVFKESIQELQNEVSVEEEMDICITVNPWTSYINT